MTTNPQNSNKIIKQTFLQELLNCDTLEQALETANIPKGLFYTFLIKDKVFLKNFDKIINLKLEVALLDSALKSKAAGALSFSLSNRLPLKYNKIKENKEQQEAPQIVYVQEK